MKKDNEMSDVPFFEADTSIARISVVLLHIDSKKMCCIDIARLPQEGDIMQFGTSIFKVEKISHVSLSKNGRHPGRNPVHIYLMDASEEEKTRYLFESSNHWDRNDDITDFFFKIDY